MKRTIWIAAFILVVNAGLDVSAQDKSCVNQLNRWSSGNELDVAGPVKTIRVEEQIYEFESHFIYQHDKPLLKERFEFDRQGRKTEDYTYTVDGRESPKTADIYNDKNWLTRQETYSALTQKPYLETRYSYDKNGNILEAAQYSLEDNKLLQKWSFRYESSRNYVEFTDTDSRNKVQARVGFTKDAQCRTHEISTFQPDGELKTKTTLSFNDKNLAVGAVTRSAIGAVLGTRKFEYSLIVAGTGSRSQILLGRTRKESRLGN